MSSPIILAFLVSTVGFILVLFQLWHTIIIPVHKKYTVLVPVYSAPWSNKAISISIALNVYHFFVMKILPIVSTHGPDVRREKEWGRERQPGATLFGPTCCPRTNSDLCFAKPSWSFLGPSSLLFIRGHYCGLLKTLGQNHSVLWKTYLLDPVNSVLISHLYFTKHFRGRLFSFALYNYFWS